jgi:hypothetical protein
MNEIDGHPNSDGNVLNQRASQRRTLREVTVDKTFQGSVTSSHVVHMHISNEKRLAMCAFQGLPCGDLSYAYP